MREYVLKNNWTLQPCNPYVPLRAKSTETGAELGGIYQPIPAEVPGSVYLDLLRAGIIEDPYYERNSLRCEWVANKWWVYRCEFPIDERGSRGRAFLRFEGMDNAGYICFNGENLGRREGINLPFELEITGKLRAQNTLTVVLESPQEDIPQIGFTSLTRTQRPRFGYGWDFCTRLVNVGLYGRVSLIERGSVTVLERRLTYRFAGEDVSAKISLTLSAAEPGEYGVEVRIGERAAERRLLLKAGDNRVTVPIRIPNVRRWEINGRGTPELYDLEVRVLEREREVSDVWQQRVGFRELELRANEGAPEGALPYQFCLNGKPFYVKGVNFVPVDLMFGEHLFEKTERLLDLMRDAGVNLVRVWGGGLIESEAFFDACGERGILVWQEFIQSGSGIENLPSVEPGFLKKLKAVSESAVKRLRNYPALAVWSGGNELSDGQGRPLGFEHPNLKMLRSLVRRSDGGRTIFPTSASGPNFFIDPDRPGCNHDVHGFWKYEGDREHLSLFNRSDSLFHSEFGVDGVNNREILEEIFADENLVVTDSIHNLSWRHHGEYWDTLTRDQKMFGEITDLDEYIKLSQFLQYEGLRYAIESNRRRAFSNGGSIVWQLNEPYKNASCTNVVDYHGRPKMGYYALKIAYQNNLGTARYERLIYDRGETVRFDVFLTADGPVRSRALDVILTDSGAVLLEKETVTAQTGGGRSVFVKSFEFPMPETGNLILSLFGEAGDVNRMIFFARERDGRVDRETAIRDIGYLYKLVRNAK